MEYDQNLESANMYMADARGEIDWDIRNNFTLMAISHSLMGILEILDKWHKTAEDHLRIG